MLLSIGVLASGCASGNNILHSDAIAEARTDSTRSCTLGPDVTYREDNVIRVYMDRFGDLYPGLAVDADLPADAFRNSTQGLLSHFASQGRACTVGGRAPADPNWRDILPELGLAADHGAASCSGTPPEDVSDDQIRAWARVQDEIRGRIARTVQSATEQSSGPLILLVHGYNVPQPECVYASLRQRIEQEAGEAADGAVYLLVKWDGLTSKGALGPTTIWSEAQYNFPLVGQGLRRLMNHPDFPTDIDLRAITHSSGGPVVAHALWNGFGAEGIDEDECTNLHYGAYLRARAAGTLAPPPRFRDARVGMIVPATPESIFREFDADASPVSRIVLGVNPRDFAVTKAMASCTVRGNTCLATRPSYARAAAHRFNDIDGVDLLLYDFRGFRGTGPNGEQDKQGLLWESHDFETYLIRDDFSDLVRAVFHDAVPEDESEDYLGAVRAERVQSRRSQAGITIGIRDACTRYIGFIDGSE